MRAPKDAIEACQRLSRGEQEDLLGLAVGTLGRAQLHAGNLEAAEPRLREAMDHHERHVPTEWPRSASYLAICLRRSKRAEDALALVQRALIASESGPASSAAETTAVFLRLERGRIFAEMGHFEDSANDLRSVVDAQPRAEAYPRLGAHRTLVRVLVTLRREREARENLEICVRVARTEGAETLRKVGAVAAREAALDERPLLPIADLDSAWKACFPECKDPERVMSTWIY